MNIARIDTDLQAPNNNNNLCQQFDETTDHISACLILAKEQYIRHDKVCVQLHFNICKEMGYNWTKNTGMNMCQNQ